MKTNLKYGSFFTVAGSIVALALGFIGFAFIDPVAEYPITYFVVGIPASVFLMVVFGMLAVFVAMRETVTQGSIEESPGFGSLLLVLATGILFVLLSAVMFMLDVGPGFNFGFAWAMGGFAPVSCSLICGLLYLGVRNMKTRKMV